MAKDLLFALDIGTRNVVGLVGEMKNNQIHIIAWDRQEHHTRAMLDGQIHSVPEVAKVIDSVKLNLEQICGPLKKTAVAAAGRALLTVKSQAEIETTLQHILTEQDERALEFAAIQSAQGQLAASHTSIDPSEYYCVGYNIINYSLDTTILSSLIGQRGKLASISLIATFLPRQVIDSIQTALQLVGLEMSSLTLEPIAAINVLVPPTMRHLNLALVDVGAGTSDVAITQNGFVTAFGMVPCAGDEITESLSRNYLLDFNIAEILKKQLSGKIKKATYTDIFGTPHKTTVTELCSSLMPCVAELSQSISKEILSLNTATPQAVLLVGGGSLTPQLPQTLAESLGLPSARVAIKLPDNIDGFARIPADLLTPDAVTPLGILKVAGSKSLNFVNITVNERPIRLFNLSSLNIADALLAAGINIKKVRARPGLGITLTINNETTFLPGSTGKNGQILLNGSPANFTDPIQEGDIVEFRPAVDGTTPSPMIADLISIPACLQITINNSALSIPPVITVNGNPCSADTPLTDRDVVIIRTPDILKDILSLAEITAESQYYIYFLDGEEISYPVLPLFTVNNRMVDLETKISSGDYITIAPGNPPTMEQILNLSLKSRHFIDIVFNGATIQLPVRRYTLLVNGKPVNEQYCPPSHSHIEYSVVQKPPLISEVLLAAEFDPRQIPPGSSVDILLNGMPVEFTATVNNHDKVDVIIRATS